MPGNPIDLDEVDEFMEDEYTQEDYDAQDEVEPEEDEDDEYEAAGALPRGRRAGGRACLPGARRARMLCWARRNFAACLPPGALPPPPVGCHVCEAYHGGRAPTWAAVSGSRSRRLGRGALRRPRPA
jgi:hypothetical protein